VSSGRGTTGPALRGTTHRACCAATQALAAPPQSYLHHHPPFCTYSAAPPLRRCIAAIVASCHSARQRVPTPHGSAVAAAASPPHLLPELVTALRPATTARLVTSLANALATIGAEGGSCAAAAAGLPTRPMTATRQRATGSSGGGIYAAVAATWAGAGDGMQLLARPGSPGYWDYAAAAGGGEPGGLAGRPGASSSSAGGGAAWR
jgi:hypothetical protein